MKKIMLFSIVFLVVLGTSFAHAGPVGRVVNMGIEAASTASSGYNGYSDAEEEKDSALAEAGTDAVVTGVVVAGNVATASLAGAGSLAGYAGIASTVSSLGLGSVTTAIAGAMGSSATGAAATAVVTCAVGGPVVMGAILSVGVAATGYGLYKGGQAFYRWLSE